MMTQITAVWETTNYFDSLKEKLNKTSKEIIL